MSIVILLIVPSGLSHVQIVDISYSEMSLRESTSTNRQCSSVYTGKNEQRSVDF